MTLRSVLMLLFIVLQYVAASRYEIVAHLALYNRRRWTALSLSCPCRVFVRIFRIIVAGVCMSARILSVSILSAVWILSVVGIRSVFYKKAVRCLSVRPDKDETELSGLSLSLSADVCFMMTNLDTFDIRMSNCCDK